MSSIRHTCAAMHCGPGAGSVFQPMQFQNLHIVCAPPAAGPKPVPMATQGLALGPRFNDDPTEKKSSLYFNVRCI